MVERNTILSAYTLNGKGIFPWYSFTHIKILLLHNDSLYYKPSITQLNFSLVQLEAVAGDVSSVAQMVPIFFDRVENKVGKGENAAYLQYLLPQCFQKLPFLRILKLSFCNTGLQTYNTWIDYDYFRLFIVTTGCPSEWRPQKTVSC